MNESAPPGPSSPATPPEGAKSAEEAAKSPTAAAPSPAAGARPEPPNPPAASGAGSAGKIPLGVGVSVAAATKVPAGAAKAPPSAPPPPLPGAGGAQEWGAEGGGHGPGPYRTPGEPRPSAAPPSRVPARAILLAVAGLFAALLVVLPMVVRPAAPRRARGIGARLDLAAGDVTVSEAEGGLKALSGMPLRSGASVATGKGARAMVRTGEGAALFLRGETSLTLLERGVEVGAGEVWLEAPRAEGEAFECKAGAYAVSASDAGVSIKREGKDVTVYVARGLAVLTSPGGRVEVAAGEQGVARAEGKPQVTPVAFWQDWTGGMGDQRGARSSSSGTGRLYGLDPAAPPGAPARKLGIAKQVVRAVIRNGVAETEVDQTFSNPGGRPIEGYYWFTVPAMATVTGFALETDGQLVEGEVIERREAAARYEAAVRAAVDPALLEWVDGRTYRARIFPIPASGTRRVVLRYVELLPSVEGKTRYVYPMRSDDPVRFDEFALSVDVGAAAKDVELASSLDARVEANGRVVSMRRSGYVPRADFQLELVDKKPKPAVSAWRFQAGVDQADYVMLRYAPGEDFSKRAPASADVVLVVDTSAGGDEGARQLRVAAAEGALRALSDGDHFALVALDVAPVVVYPAEGLAPASEAEIGRALEKLSDHAVGGATDLGAMFEPSLARLHGKEQAALVYVGDGAPTSGETGPEALLERLRRSLTGSRARFFAVGTGGGARHELLAELARAGGGQYLRVDEPWQATSQALRLASAVKTAVITDVAVDLGAGLDQPLYSATGKLSRGEELVLLARTHHPLPDQITVRGRVGGKDFSEKHELKVDTTSVTASLVPRLWAAEYVHRLMGSGDAQDDNRAQILQLGVEYGLVTPYTSSIALESEAAYARQGIPRKRSRVRGVRLTSIASPADEERLALAFAPAAPALGCDANKSMAPPAARGTESSEAATEVGNAPAAAAAPEPPAPHGRFELQKSDEGERAAPENAKTEPYVAAVPAIPAATATVGAPVGGVLGTTSGGGRAIDRDSPYDTASTGRGASEASPAARPVVRFAAPKSGGGAAKPHAPPPPPPAREAERRADGKDKAPAPKPPAGAAPTTVARVAFSRSLSRCSDVAARPLSERLVIWQKRARKASNAAELALLYDQAYAACELPDWRDEAALLDVVQRRVDTEQAAETVLAHFGTFPEGQRFLAKNLLRRTVDVRVAAAVSRVLYGGVDWVRLDRELADEAKPEKQLARLKAAMLAAPGDPQGEVRLVRLLARAPDKRQEAMAHGRRLRDRGFLTPTLAQQLGDVLAEAGERDEALRTYSEIVEFDGTSPPSRRVLGDIFFRQGWYPAAYRQYKTLTDLDAKNPLAWLRLANAAAGAGRVDEALRIDREVAGGEGTPGPNDPRAFARLLSAARLGALLAQPDPAAGVTPEAVSRKLKELSLFSGPGTLALLVWRDLDARLVLGAADEKKEQLVGEATDAGEVGLYALLGSTESWARAPHAARFRSELLDRKVPFELVALTWDGKAFQVAVTKGELEPGAKQKAL
ncbi:MAG TPA: VIT domain-containing protein [Polyangiaceae bacterium]|nr:VIT domain-containing protein [Polyangiaceae bacterium]